MKIDMKLNQYNHTYTTFTVCRIYPFAILLIDYMTLSGAIGNIWGGYEDCQNI